MGHEAIAGATHRGAKAMSAVRRMKYEMTRKQRAARPTIEQQMEDMALPASDLDEITGGLTLEQARALPIGGPGYWLSEEEIVRVTGNRQPVHQLVELARLGFARAWRARRNSGRVRVPRLHVVAELDERRRA